MHPNSKGRTTIFGSTPQLARLFARQPGHIECKQQDSHTSAHHRHTSASSRTPIRQGLGEWISDAGPEARRALAVQPAAAEKHDDTNCLGTMSSSAPEWRGFSQSLALGVCHADVMKLFTPWKDFRLHRDLQILDESKVHDHTFIAMNQLLEYAGITIDQLVHVHIYTDGSHLKPDDDDSQQTAWSFNVLGELADGQCVMLGFVSDDVMIDASEQRFLGATKASALTAEGSAICWALLWWLQSGIQAYAGLTVHSDCLPAGLHMAGEAGWRHHPIMASILRGLATIAACYAHVAFQHVKGHSGDPFNE